MKATGEDHINRGTIIFFKVEIKDLVTGLKFIGEKNYKNLNDNNNN